MKTLPIHFCVYYLLMWSGIQCGAPHSLRSYSVTSSSLVQNTRNTIGEFLLPTTGVIILFTITITRWALREHRPSPWQPFENWSTLSQGTILTLLSTKWLGFATNCTASLLAPFYIYIYKKYNQTRSCYVILLTNRQTDSIEDVTYLTLATTTIATTTINKGSTVTNCSYTSKSTPNQTYIRN